MEIYNILNNNKLKRTSKNTWHTKDYEHEIMYLDDIESITIIKLDDKKLDGILFKGEISKKAEDVLNSII